MGNIVKSIGHGLLAAGIVLIAIYALGLYLRDRDTFRDVLDPTAIRTYLVLLPLVPGLLLLWLGDHIATRRRN
jgi:hypothetical protein